jgi:hypothetical protein
MADPAADLHERTERTAALLLSAAQSKPHMWISDDLRIGVDDAAKILGMKPSGFRKRLPESGIRVYRIGGQGHKRSLRIFDLAAWIERESDVGVPITGALVPSAAP